MFNDDLDDDPYRMPGRARGALDDAPDHTPYAYVETRTIVKFFAMVSDPDHRHQARAIECEPDELPDNVIRSNGQPWTYYQAENRRAYGERRAQGDTAAEAIKILRSQPPLCPYDCPACQRERANALGDHEDEYGPYLGSLDAESVIRQVKR